MASFNLNSFKCSPIPSPGGESLKDLIDAGQLTTESLDAPPFVTTTTPTIDEERESPGPEAMDPWNDCKHDGGRTRNQHHSLVPDIHVAPLAEAIRQSAKDLLDDIPSDAEAMEDAEYGIPVTEEPGYLKFTSSRKRMITRKVMLAAGIFLAVVVGLFASSGSHDSTADEASEGIDAVNVGVRGSGDKKWWEDTPTQKWAEDQPDECEDDPTYVHSSGKTCELFVKNVGRVALHQGRCSEPAGSVDDLGNELLVRDFCRLSCGECGDTRWSHLDDPEYWDPHNGDPEYQRQPAPETPAQAVPSFPEETVAAAAEPVAETPAVEQPMAEAPAVDEEPAETPGVAEEPPNAAEEIVAETLAGEAPVEPLQASNEPPSAHVDCVDDFTFVFQENGKSCVDFLAHMASPAVHANRCIKPTGIVDDKGNELLVKDFCLYSCGTCGDSKWSHMSEPEALILASEETFVDQMVEGGPTEDSIEAWIDATFGEGSVGSQAP